MLGSRVEGMGPRFEGMTALLVGGTGGIGRATALRLSEEGCVVVVTGATEQEVSAFSEEAGSQVWAEVLDVRRNDAVEGLVGRLDRLDVLVNLAGVGRG